MSSDVSVNKNTSIWPSSMIITTEVDLFPIDRAFNRPKETDFSVTLVDVSADGLNPDVNIRLHLSVAR